ncbi:MAG: hypothetical protein AAGC55_15885 [Myxococcota bacterium]
MVNERWQAFQQAVVTADKERTERNTAVDAVRRWVQRWRPVVLLVVPGASTNLRALPPAGATPDDMIRVAEDLRQFLGSNPGAADIRDAALSDIGDGVTIARSELAVARAARPVAAATREAFTQSVISANEVLVRGSEVVRAIFGATSPEYKQFIGRDGEQAEAAEAAESITGEAADDIDSAAA